MPLNDLHLHNRQHVKLAKRHLDITLVKFLQQHGYGKTAGTFCSRITTGMRTVPSWEALSSCPDVRRMGLENRGLADFNHFIA